MQLSPEAELVLQAIFAIGKDRSLGIGKRLRLPTPAAPELYELCELLAKSPGEEDLQKFLERNPGFLTSLVGTPDNADLAVLFKPPVGTQYRADFCVLQAHQGGSLAHLLEIETSHDPLFNQNGTPSRRLAYALKQIEDWRIWINNNPVHYATELVRHAQNLPLYGDQVQNSRGVRVTDPEQVHRIWSTFGGFGQPYFSYTVLIGRWSALTESDKARLISRNRHGGHQMCIYTYEQLARLANFRLERDREGLSWNNPTIT